MAIELNGTKPILETPYERAGVITPGLPVLPHGVERHPIPGGGSRAVRMDRGDTFSVMDREGLQPAELVFFALDGSSDAAMFGARGGGKANDLKVALQNDRSGLKVAQALATAGFDLADADSTRLFEHGSQPGDMQARGKL